MSKCAVCKYRTKTLLRLQCNHDVCIKCAADNYFLNCIAANRHHQQNKKSSAHKIEHYFCEVCLQVTPIDQSTVNGLKKWYIDNVNISEMGLKQNKKHKRNESNTGRSSFKHNFNDEYELFFSTARSRDSRNKGYYDSSSPFQIEYYNGNHNLITKDFKAGNQSNSKPKFKPPFASDYHDRILAGNRDSYHFIEKHQNVPGKSSRSKKSISSSKRISGVIAKRNELRNRSSSSHGKERKAQLHTARSEEPQRIRIDSLESERRILSNNDSDYQTNLSHLYPKKVSHPNVLELSYDFSQNGPNQNQNSDSSSSHEYGKKQSHRKGFSKAQKHPISKPANRMGQQSGRFGHFIQNRSISESYQGHQKTQKEQGTQLYLKEPQTQVQQKQSRPKKEPLENTTAQQPQQITQDNFYPKLPPGKAQFCKIHEDQKVLYYCSDCRALICSECTLYGNHKTHTIDTLKKTSLKMKETLHGLICQLNNYLLIEEQREHGLLQKINIIAVQCNKQKENLKTSFESFLKNVQSKYSQILEQLQQSSCQSLSRYKSSLRECQLKSQEYCEMKNSMKDLSDWLANSSPSNHQISGAHHSSRNLNTELNSLSTVNFKDPLSSEFGATQSRRVNRQLDHASKEDSFASTKRIVSFDSNIEELQAKITEFNEYVSGLKGDYAKHLSRGANKSPEKRSDSKALNQDKKSSFEMQDSLKFSESSLLLDRSPTKTSSGPRYDSKQKNQIPDFFRMNPTDNDEGQHQSINLMFEKSPSSLSQIDLQEVKLGHAQTIVESLKQIEDIIQQFKVQHRSFQSH